MGLFKSRAEIKKEKERERLEEEIEQKKIDEYRKKCNFLTSWGECYLAIGNYPKDCDYDDCIFMRLLKAK